MLVLAILWALASSFYFWTATSSGNPIVFHRPQHDYYNQLANGFLNGELSIPTVPPARLVHLADPYNPAANDPYQASMGIHDLSLYHGHLYLSWGPTPVLTLFIPWRILGLGALPANLAAIIYSVIGLALAFALFELLVARFLPRVGSLKVALGGIALATSSVVPYVLRRPQVYEDAICCAYCFICAGLYFLVFGLLSSRRRTLLLIVGSVCVGLAIGARFDALVLGLVILAVAYLVDRKSRDQPIAKRIRQGAAVIVPCGVCVVLIFAYNFIRFGDPLQIGSAYQLAGYDPTKTPFDQWGYVSPGIFYYVFAPIRFTLAFPFTALPPPAFYAGNVATVYTPEVAGGLLSTTPILVILVCATWLLRGRVAELGHIVLAFATAALAFIFMISFTLPSVTMRYEADFASLLVLGAVLTWFAWNPVSRSTRTLVNLLGTGMILFGAFVGVSLSVTGPTDQMQLGNNAGYQSLESAFEFIPETITKIEGRPRVVRVINPEAAYPANLSNYGTFDAGNLFFALYPEHEEVDIVAPDAGYYVIDSHLARRASAPEKGPVDVYLQIERSLYFAQLPCNWGDVPNFLELPDTVAHSCGVSLAVTSSSPGSEVITGWAVDDQKLQPAKEVIAVVGQRVVATTRPDIYRPDVATYFVSKATTYSGFRLDVPSAAIRQHVQIYSLNVNRTVSRLGSVSNTPSPVNFGNTLQFLTTPNGVRHRVQTSGRPIGFVEQVAVKVVLSEEGALSAKVFLNAGLNRVYMWVTFTGEQPAGGAPYIVNAYGLTVRSVSD